MGCLNSHGQFSHWFGNIHFSGPCNRACYFCIGQHMMALDPLNNLDKNPLDGLEEFIALCDARRVRDVNLTGTNTDPSLYKHQEWLVEFLRSHAFRVGIRTNGAKKNIPRYDHASLSITSLNKSLYRATMGMGVPPDVNHWLDLYGSNLKVNVVLCPETIKEDLVITLAKLAAMGVYRINLREPYGQPRIGNPFAHLKEDQTVKGMPVYHMDGSSVCYWDVHYCEVESVNLYANGRVSETYPITKGHAETGIVLGQEHFEKSGRVRMQWVS